MYRVLLVDDESMARVGLRTTFDWEGNGFHLVGEASNGEKALKWIENQEVDILITDIAMPVMDGLELTRMTRKLCPWVKVLLLSCHNDFEYVREGIRLGASDYLLKPTLETENLKQILEEMKLQVKQEKEKMELFHKWNEHTERSKRTEIEQSIVRMLTGSNDGGVAEKVPFLDQGYRVALCLLSIDSDQTEQNQEIGIFETLIFAKDIFYSVVKQGIAFSNSTNQLVFLLPLLSHLDRSEDELETFRQTLKRKGYSLTLGVSNNYASLQNVKDAYQEAINAAHSRFFHGPDGIHYAHTLTARPERDRQFAKLKNNLKEYIQAGFKQKAAECMQTIAEFWNYTLKTPSEVVEEAQELLSLLYVCKSGDAAPMEEIEALRRAQFVDEVRERVTDCFEQSFNNEILDHDLSLHQRIVQQAIEYINLHYTETITLPDIANHVAVSKNYFSELFKKETGLNFIDYLIQIRVKRAIELLQTTRFKVYEVAEKSGFNDVKYFSKQFKKMVGMTPAEFQGMRKDVEYVK